MRKLCTVLMAVILLQSSTFKALGQSILQESFEGSSFPPPGWKIVNNGAGNTWKQNTDANYAYEGNNSMFYGYSSTNAADAWAFTPSLPLNTNPVTISFFVTVRDPSAPENLKLTIGNDNVVAHQTTVLLDSAGITNVTFTKWQATYIPTSAGNYTFGFNCYSTANQWNLYVDSVTIFQELNTCNGKPNAGVLVGPTSVCSGTTFDLSTVGTTLANGISYQLQSNTDSINWVDVSGETSPMYSPSQTVNTQYRLRVTCDSTGDTTYSTILNVTLTPTLFCSYCSPNNGSTLHTATTPTIDSVAIVGTTLHNTDLGAPGNGYTQFPFSGNTTATLKQAATYKLVTNFSASTIASLWIDWNQNGTYEASEWTQITTSGSGVLTTSITVPSNAKLGATGLRIRTRSAGATNGAVNACTQFASGETEEYIINVVANTQCNGTPSAGYAYSVPAACVGSTVTISDSASSMAIGIVYQWQVSSDKTTWTNLTGATTPSYSFTLSDSGYYRLKVLCTSSNDSVYSNTIKIALNPSVLCYCSPYTGVLLHTATNPTIDSVTFNGTTLQNANVGSPANGYTLFPDSGNTTTSLQQALTYNLKTNFSGSVIASVWIDWDQSGTFDDNEWTQITTNGSGTITTPITIPITALTGITGMRIRSRVAGASNGSGDACTQFASGETEDYLITINAGVSCTSKPLGGYAYSSSSVCAGTTVTLSDTGASSAIGINYQWQISNDNTTWSDVDGATTLNYNFTVNDTFSYRLKVVCTASNDSAYSNTFKIAITPANLCYCSPLTGVVLHSSTTPTIDSVSMLTTTLNNADIGAPTSGYTQFPASGNTTATLVAGASYTLNTFYSGGTAIASFWGDWNQDGNYDASEWTQISKSATGSVKTTIKVPSTATPGLTGIRIRARVSTSSNGSADACTQFGSGETEEYLVTITQPVPVTIKSFNGNKIGNVNKLIWSTLNEINSDGFAIERSTDGVHYSAIGFVSTLANNGNSIQQLNYQFTDTKPAVVAYYRLKRIDKNSSYSYSSVVVLKRDDANILSIVSVYPNPATNVVNLLVYAPHNQPVNLLVTDFAGKVILSKKTNLENANNYIQLDISNLVSSNYLIKVVGNNGSETSLGKFFKN